MKEAVKGTISTDIIETCETNINKLTGAEEKLGNLIRKNIGDLTHYLEEKGLHLPEFITLESTVIEPISEFDEEKIHTIEYFKRDNQLIKVERVTTEVKDFPLADRTFAVDIPRKEQKPEILKELDSKSWVKHGPKVIQVLKALNQDQIPQKS